MGHSLITKFPQVIAIQRHLNTMFQKVEGGITQKTAKVPHDKQYPLQTCRIRMNWQDNGEQNKYNPTLNTEEVAYIAKASSSITACSKRTFPLLLLPWILMVTMEHLQHCEKVRDQEYCILEKKHLYRSFFWNLFKLNIMEEEICNHLLTTLQHNVLISFWQMAKCYQVSFKECHQSYLSPWLAEVATLLMQIKATVSSPLHRNPSKSLLLHQSTLGTSFQG